MIRAQSWKHDCTVDDRVGNVCVRMHGREDGKTAYERRHL